MPMPWSLQVFLLASGGGHLSDARFQTGSATVTTSADHRSQFVVNEDEGTVSRVGPRGTTRQDVGLRPPGSRSIRATGREADIRTGAGPRSVVFTAREEAWVHNGPMWTDNRSCDMFGVEGVVTRHLVGIAEAGGDRCGGPV